MDAIASFLPAEALARLFGHREPLLNIEPSWNLAPSQPSLVVRRHPETGERHLDVLRWGLLPYFTKDAAHARRPINPRAETVATPTACTAVPLPAGVAWCGRWCPTNGR